MPPQNSQSNRLPPGYTLDSPGSTTGVPAGYSLDTTPPLPNAGLAPPAGAPPKPPAGAPFSPPPDAAKLGPPALGWKGIGLVPSAGGGPLAQGMTSLEATYSQAPRALLNMIPSGPPLAAYDPESQKPVLTQLKDIATDIATKYNPHVTSGGETDWGATVANVLPFLIGARYEAPGMLRSAGVKLGFLPGEAALPPEAANLVKEKYSPTGDQIAASMRSNSTVDLPAEAHNAAPALKEAAADRGITSEDFKGRNGPKAYQAISEHAMDINNARSDAAVAPIRDMAVPPAVLTENPALARRFTPAQIKSGLTYGQLYDELKVMNKQLRTSNFYSKPPSAQYAVQDPLADLHDAANQARNVVYDTASQVTGQDLRGLKGQQASLIKLHDVANSTANTLSEQAAKQNVATIRQRIGGAVKHAINIKANPTNAFESGLGDPTADFNRNMQRAFSDVKPKPGSVMKNGRLVEPPPAVLTPPPGSTPPEPNRQMLLNLARPEEGAPVPRSLGAAAAAPATAEPPGAAAPEQTFYHGANAEGTQAIEQSGRIEPRSLTQAHLTPDRATAASYAKNNGGKVFAVKASDLPPDVLAHFNGTGRGPIVLSSGHSVPISTEGVTLPESLRSAAGIERRATPRQAPLNATELQTAIQMRRPVQTPFDVTEGAMETINRDPLMPQSPGQGGHAGGGVASIEELARPGVNYTVSKSGGLTYHGKSFDPGSTPKGGAHVTVLPDGTLRVNEGTLTPQMEKSIRDALRK